MKKIIFLIIFSLINLSFFGNTIAKDKSILWIVTDSSNIQWCKFPFSSDWSIDKTVIDVRKNAWYVLCSDYKLSSTGAKTNILYRINFPEGQIVIDWVKKCFEVWKEIECKNSNISASSSNNDTSKNFEDVKPNIYIYTDLNGEEWCDFPANTSLADSLSISDRKTAYDSCKKHNISSKSAVDNNKYNIIFPSENVIINWKLICLKNWKEIECDNSVKSSLWDTSSHSGVNSINSTWESTLSTWSKNTNSGVLSKSWFVNTNWKCTLNWKDVDCGIMAEKVDNFFKYWLSIFFAVIIAFIILSIFWLRMLIHAIINQIPNKILWLLVIFFLNFIGAVLYYFVVKVKFNKPMITV